MQPCGKRSRDDGVVGILYYHSESSKLNLKHLMKCVIITVFAGGEELTGLDKYHVSHEHFESFTCCITPINFCARLGTAARYARAMQIFKFSCSSSHILPI